MKQGAERAFARIPTPEVGKPIPSPLGDRILSLARVSVQEPSGLVALKCRPFSFCGWALDSNPRHSCVDWAAQDSAVGGLIGNSG